MQFDSVKFEQILRNVEEEVRQTSNDYEDSNTYQNNNSHSNEDKSQGVCKSISEAYTILGCSETDSFEIIKSSYRGLSLKFHPDTISGKDLADEFIELAEQKFKSINSAYEMIKKNKESIKKSA